MRTFSVAALVTGFGLLLGMTLLNEPVPNASAQAREFEQPSIAIDKLTSNVKNLQDQTFDMF